MIFGYSTNAFVKYSLMEAINRIARLGFSGLEIMCDRPHLYPPDFGEKGLAEIKSAIDGHGLKVTNLNSFTLFAVGDTYLPSWIEPEEKRRQIRIRHTLDCLELARDLGAKTVSIPPGGPLGDTPRKKALNLFYKGLEQVVPRAEFLGVTLAVEPEPGLLLERTSEFKDFIKDIKSPAVKLNFDMGHFYCVGEEPGQAFEDLFEWVCHVHLEDIAPSREHRHLIAGHGAISFLDVFTMMVKLGYQGDISLELYPYVDMPEAAGRQSLTYLLPVFAAAGLRIS
ncbi:MAG: sugar phosphate isomerase/epimerase family protein [Desulfobacterales bacterium]|nr:sugar phosphate isomerase/epimerase family protein [Desulfobacterales bacterium]